jgi:hypothetical protein
VETNRQQSARQNLYLTAAGKKQLAEEQGRWARMSTAIAGLMARGEA